MLLAIFIDKFNRYLRMGFSFMIIATADFIEANLYNKSYFSKSSLLNNVRKLKCSKDSLGERRNEIDSDTSVN